MRDTQGDDGLEMAALRSFGSRGDAAAAVTVLESNGIPAIVTGTENTCVRVPVRFMEEAATLLAAPQPYGIDGEKPRSMPFYWQVMLGLLAGTAALFVAVWVSDRIVGVFR